MGREILTTSCAIAILAISAATDHVPGAEQKARPNGTNEENLVAVVGPVTVLTFNTDRPVHHARLVVNGRVVATSGTTAQRSGLKIAVIPWGTNVTVYLQVPQESGYMQGDYKPAIPSNWIEQKRYNRSRSLVLTNWTEVFAMDTKEGGVKGVYTMSVEVK
jgi:hypothetical protein